MTPSSVIRATLSRASPGRQGDGGNDSGDWEIQRGKESSRRGIGGVLGDDARASKFARPLGSQPETRAARARRTNVGRINRSIAVKRTARATVACAKPRRQYVTLEAQMEMGRHPRG